jgi:cysteine-rich repeat protein
VTFRILHSDGSTPPSSVFDLSINGEPAGSVAALNGECPIAPLEARLTDPALLALVDPTLCNVFTVDIRPAAGGVRVGYVQIVVETGDGPLDVCAFDGAPENPLPTCAERSLCGAPGSMGGMTHVTGWLNCHVCGDRVVDPDEECDDGNDASGDGCSPECTLEDLDADGVIDLEDRCLGTRVPEGVPTQRLGVNRYAITTGSRNRDGLIVFDTANSGRQRPARIFTTGDTAGCSCEQIIVSLGGRGQDDVRLGCSLDTMETWIGGLP